jgi:hypothetical protein
VLATIQLFGVHSGTRCRQNKTKHPSEKHPATPCYTTTIMRKNRALWVSKMSIHQSTHNRPRLGLNP